MKACPTGKIPYVSKVAASRSLSLMRKHKRDAAAHDYDYDPETQTTQYGWYSPAQAERAAGRRAQGSRTRLLIVDCAHA